MAEARIVFHLPPRHLADWAETRHLVLFRRIAEVLGPRGAKIVQRDRTLGPFRHGPTDAYDDGDLHIIDSGRAKGPGVLNASIAYLPPFWHLSPHGVLAESGIGDLPYVQEEIPSERARAFIERMRLRYVVPRRSRRVQVQQVARLPEGAIAVFLQGRQPYENGLAYMEPIDMLAAVAAGSEGRPVLVKPHPLSLESDAEVIARVRAMGLAVTPTSANVHDIIGASVAIVSFNSACALEGFLHRKPAILFGASDFHVFAETVRQPGEFPAALARARARPGGGYARFLYWYFVQNCLNISARDFEARLLDIFAAHGFPPERLGLTTE
ncbi:MAG: hypothetical protein RLZZ528_2575 [Pseudomonadota bacterium]